MINAVFTILSLTVLSVAIFIREKEVVAPTDTPQNETKVLSAEIETNQTQPSTPTPTQSPVEKDNTFLNEEDWKYPNSTVFSSQSGALVLTSTDSAKLVIDWYKTKVLDNKYRVISLIESNNVSTGKQNKILVSKDEKEVSINIDGATPSGNIKIEIKQAESE